MDGVEPTVYRPPSTVHRPLMSQITTHILDTASGKPAAGIPVTLEQQHSGGWQTIAQGITNSDGRITDLLLDNIVLDIAEYKLIFETKGYFLLQNITAFYPAVEIRFYVRDAAHYHIPLLLSPFGYTTYRGS